MLAQPHQLEHARAQPQLPLRHQPTGDTLSCTHHGRAQSANSHVVMCACFLNGFLLFEKVLLRRVPFGSAAA